MPTQKYYFLTFTFIMSFFMSAVMSLSMLVLASANLADALANWPKAWGVTMLVAFPVSLLVVPCTQKIVSKILSA
ncbi:DUF2798 domain-containing protein [Alteromonas sediminis]|uniref:DUF2798 domain-containing protein n=1 Tax=Alteromonas sediminis TaxID=2259342 RepID=A0A3N5Y1H3_9ALTE|nr:DUF2798 domain-containing protein [Alteromonas sediminis]RPJ67000.1 DUF2798 domain-containing protein [Alteromonas sediminis]